ncbi:hypothetical protein BX661DRAFT_59069 [Kickxella alabastrina]|uniref:uncharacterized protein n=1 Tax=Kickxella alabastrina TaxID=61397 RepID=UPI00221EC13A|nr:uncharacterized protein BX661DRAFT_59069 [Kickxella alabastrina]KAI7822433.1 hypothetical protein BX661DRAFT_59069 [Kickxella alabastrina]
MTNANKVTVAASRMAEVIIREILTYVADCSLDITNWKKCLPILAVCRNWREAACPIAYRTAYIEYKGHRRCIILWPESLCTAEAWSNNIQLAYVTGNFKYVRSFHFGLYTHSVIGCFIDNAQQLLQLQYLDWSNVTSLSYRGLLDNPSFEETDTVDHMIELVAYHLTGIEHLNVKLFGVFAGKPVAQQVLVEKYARQLMTLKCNTMVKAPECGFSNRLTALSIGLPKYHAQLFSSIDTRTLKRLCLTNVRETFKWMYTDNQNTNRLAEFPNLESLEMGFNDQYENGNNASDFESDYESDYESDFESDSKGDGDRSATYHHSFFIAENQAVQFPKLENLFLANLVITLKDLLADNVQHKIPVFEDLQTYEGIEWLSEKRTQNTKIHITKWYCSKMSKKAGYGGKYVNYGSYIRETNLALDEETMCNIGNSIAMQPGNIDCSSLCKLCLLYDMGISEIIVILHHLPNLTELEICHFVCQGYVDPEGHGINKDLESPVQSICSRLKKLMIKKRWQVNDPHLANELANLFIRINLLKSVFVPPGILNIMGGLAEKYGRTYPHMKTLQYNVYDSEFC